jgi:predicted PurR-regulated permease PerM
MPRPIASWCRNWKPFVKKALRYSVLQFSSCLAIFSLSVLVLGSLFYIALRSTEYREQLWDWIEETTVATFIVVVVAFAVFLIFVVIFSLHPKTRRISSKLSTFLEKPEVEELKERADTIENELGSLNRRLDGLDMKTDTTNKVLSDMQRDIGNIEDSLGNIQDTLKTITKTDNKEDRDG